MGGPLRIPSNSRMQADATQYFDPLSVDIEDGLTSPND